MRTAFILSTLLIACSLVTSYFLFARIRPSDAVEYQKLLSESRESNQSLSYEKAQQMREGVQKDIWVAGSERLHFRIQSEHSQLTLSQKKGKFEAIETLQGIQCWIQEEIDRKEMTQQIRFLFAREGTYTYPNHRFTAESVELEFYRLPGTELPLSFAGKKPYFTGLAREVELGAAMKIPTFHAYHLRAKFDPGLP